MNFYNFVPQIMNDDHAVADHNSGKESVQQSSYHQEETGSKKENESEADEEKHRKSSVGAGTRSGIKSDVIRNSNDKSAGNTNDCNRSGRDFFRVLRRRRRRKK